MAPDSDQTRMSQLEQKMARAEQRLDGHDAKLQEHESDIRAFAPLTASHAVLTEQMLSVQKTQAQILRRLDAQDAVRDEARKEQERRRVDERRDSLNSRRALYATMAAVLLTTLGGLLVNVLTAGP